MLKVWVLLVMTAQCRLIITEYPTEQQCRSLQALVETQTVVDVIKADCMEKPDGTERNSDSAR